MSDRVRTTVSVSFKIVALIILLHSAGVTSGRIFSRG